MGYYKMLAVIFVILISSVIVQGRDLFSDAFFAIAYVVMSVALFIGTKFAPSSKTAMLIGLLLIFSVGFLSTNALIEMFAKPGSPSMFFKLAIVVSLDACALFFFRYGREFKKSEAKDRRLGPYLVRGEPAKEPGE
jgi:hypothetical protein